MTNLHRSDRRYGIRDQKRDELEATFLLGSKRQNVRLVNLSCMGASVVVPFRLSKDSMFQLTLHASPSGETKHLDSVVRWIDVASNGQFQVGCRFKTPLQIEFLEALTRQGILERRRNARFEINDKILVRSEREKQPVNGLLTDISDGGLCFRSRSGFVEGDLVEIELVGERSDLPGTWYTRIVWTKQRDSAADDVACSYGCKLVGQRAPHLVLNERRGIVAESKSEKR